MSTTDLIYLGLAVSTGLFAGRLLPKGRSPRPGEKSFEEILIRFIFGVSLVALSFLVIIGSIYVLYPEVEYETTYYAADYKKRSTIPLGETASDPESFWTAVASLVGIVALTSLYYQMKLTKEATRQTKRSVDAYMRSERGVLALFQAQFDNPTVHLAYRNIGRGAVHISAAARHVRIVPTGSVVTQIVGPTSSWQALTPIVIPVAAGDIMSTSPTRNALPFPEGIEIAISDADRIAVWRARTHDLVISLIIMYSTPMRTVHENLATIRFAAGTVVGETFAGEEFAYDIMVMDASDSPMPRTLGIFTT